MLSVIRFLSLSRVRVCVWIILTIIQYNITHSIIMVNACILKTCNELVINLERLDFGFEF